MNSLLAVNQCVKGLTFFVINPFSLFVLVSDDFAVLAVEVVVQKVADVSARLAKEAFSDDAVMNAYGFYHEFHRVIRIR